MVNRFSLHLFLALRVGPAQFASVPGTACRGLEVALCELTYYHHWLNIGAELGNNEVSSTGHTTLIPDGYYNVCELDDVFQPLGTELRLHAPTGRLKLSAKTRLVLNSGLATPRVLQKEIRARPELHCRRATQTSHPSEDLRASCRRQYV